MSWNPIIKIRESWNQLWILLTGFWNDDGVWDDDNVWRDGPGGAWVEQNAEQEEWLNGLIGSDEWNTSTTDEDNWQ